jgi:hypothetical protein
VLYVHDVVKFKRKLEPTDFVNSQKLGLVASLTTEMEFVIKKFLTDKRAVLERADGEIFTAPNRLLEWVPEPFCIGVLYNASRLKCRDCMFKEQCLELYDAYKDMPKPRCVGQYDCNDEECIRCTFVVHCLHKTTNTDYIDAEYEEVNRTLTGEN